MIKNATKSKFDVNIVHWKPIAERNGHHQALMLGPFQEPQAFLELSIVKDALTDQGYGGIDHMVQYYEKNNQMQNVPRGLVKG